MDLESSGLRAKLQRYNQRAINAGMTRTIHSKQGKGDYFIALAWSITDDYTHGLACLCKNLCIVRLQ